MNNLRVELNTVSRFSIDAISRYWNIRCTRNHFEAMFHLLCYLQDHSLLSIRFYSEYSSAVEAASDMSDWEYRPDEDGADYDEDEAEEHARQYLQDRTTVIEFDGGVIVQAF